MTTATISRRSILTLAFMLTLTACVDDPTSAPFPSVARSDAGGNDLRVMTRNLYLGANLDPVLAIQDPNLVPGAIAQTWAQIVATNYPERAEALADEIVAADPHLVGLQEVVLYRRQSPSDIVRGIITPNAEQVVYDFGDLLVRALAARGANYRIVARVEDIDVEAPMYTGVGALPFDDIRYTDHDMILARFDVATTNAFSANFAASVPLTLGGLPVTLKRGWTAVDAEIGGSAIRFVNTHLETQQFRPVQEAQAAQLIAWMATSPSTVVLTGDLNSAANADAPVASRTATYEMMRTAGFEDLWLRGNHNDAGLTCCNAHDLLNPEPLYNQRIDFVMINQFRGLFVGGAQLNVVGADPALRTPSGLWPSDHAGVAAVLHLPAGSN